MSYYFFSDIDNLSIQSNNAFGPTENITVDDVTYEQYQVTSIHSATESTSAIAICRGQIFIQEQSENNDLLNIVFKPIDKQPFNFPKVQFFFYKGIRKDSLIADNDLDIVSKGTNDLADSVWAAFESTNSSGNPTKAILGLDASINDLSMDTAIEQIFSTVHENVQIWNVQAGSTLGKYDADFIGFEIIINSLFYNPTLELARNSGTFIKSKSLDSASTQRDFFDHWYTKEDILHYIDPCAFFGCFYNDSLSIINKSQVSVLKKDQIYTDLLVKFVNKNIAYIDIRNEFNFSINFFKNYSDSVNVNSTSLKVKKGDSTTFALIDYYKDNWPILRIDSSGFSSNFADYQSITFQLPSGQGDNPYPLIFFAKAYIPADKFPAEFDKSGVFQPLIVDSNFTEEFTIGLPWKSGVLLSTYVQLKYLKQNGEMPLSDALPTQIRKSDYLDAIFNTALNFDYTNSSFKTKVFDEGLYVDVRELKGYEGIFSISISFDDENVTLTAIPTIVNNAEGKRITLSANSEHKFGENTENYFEDLSLNHNGSNFLTMILSSSGEDLEVIQVKPAYNDLEEKLNIPDFRKLLGLTLTIPEWNSLIQTSLNNNFEQNYPVFIMILNKDHLVDDRDIDYTSIDLALKGFVIDGNNIKVQQVSTNINLLTYGTF